MLQKELTLWTLKGGSSQSRFVQLRPHVLYFACGRVPYFTWLSHFPYFASPHRNNFTSRNPLSRAPESQVPVHASQRPRPHVPVPVPFIGTAKILSGKAWLRGWVVTFSSPQPVFFWSAGRHCAWSDVKPLTNVLVWEWKGELAPGNWFWKLHSLVPRRCLLPHCPRKSGRGQVSLAPWHHSSR